MKQSGKVALGGMMSALALVCMLLTVLPISQLGLPALAGVMLFPIVLEAGMKWGWTAYAAVSLLSLLVTPSLEAKVMFIAFFGYYPILKALIERIRRRWLEWIGKLAVFNAAMVIAYWLLMKVFGLPADTFEIFGVNLPLVMLLLGNGVFVVYDLGLTGVVSIYIRALQPKLRHLFRR